MKQAALVRVVGDEISPIKDITKTDLDTLKNANSSIFEFNREYQLIDYVYENYNSFLLELSNMVQDFNSNGLALSPFIYDEFIRFINRNVLNILTSMKTMTEHLETRVKRTYGNESSQWSELKAQMSRAFDTEFSYSFASKLRNFVQHCGMPPIHFKFKNELATGELRNIVSLELNREKLLDGFTKWGTIVKPQLQQQPEFFCVFTLLDSLVNILFDVFARFMKETKLSEVQASRDWILEYIGESSDYQSNEYAIGYFVPNDDGSVSMNFSWIPASLFSKVKTIEHHL
ncbi:hypothetical protein AB6E50_05655 [Vibrio cyclitrophicus]